jgi:hypothetical protein
MTCTSTATIEPAEKGTAIIKFFCTDEEDNIVNPDPLQWQLVDKNGSIKNNTDFTNNDIAGTEQSITISIDGEYVTGLGYVVVLSGNDLAIDDSTDEGERYFGVQGTYDSTYGSDLPLHNEYKFNICELKNFS